MDKEKALAKDILEKFRSIAPDASLVKLKTFSENSEVIVDNLKACPIRYIMNDKYTIKAILMNVNLFDEIIQLCVDLTKEEKGEY